MTGWREGDLGCLGTGAAGFIVTQISLLTDELIVRYHSGKVASLPRERVIRPGGRRKAPTYCPTCRVLKQDGTLARMPDFLHAHEFKPNHDKTIWTCRCCGWTTNDIAYPATHAQGEPTMSKLFRLIAEENEPGAAAVYVRRVGTDGDLAVVKDEATGALLAVRPTRLEEVLPYTVGMNKVGQTHGAQFIATKGVFAVDDLLMDQSGTLWVVGAVDTKSRDAVKRFRGFKLAATPIPSGDE